MNKIKWVLVCMAMLLLVGCANTTQQSQGKDTEVWQMNEAMLEMIKEAVGCNDRRAKAILEVFQEIPLAEPVSATPVEPGSPSIIVETKDGKKYEVDINKKHYVYSIEDLSNGESLYMVIE